MLGKGTYGSVFRSNSKQAIKKADPYYGWIALREMVIFKWLSMHDYSPAVELHGISFSSYAIGMELAEIDLSKWNNIRQTTSKRCLIIRDVIKSVFLLHQIGLVHGDLKTANIIMTFNGSIKLIDFGFSGPTGWAFTKYTTPIYKDKYETNNFASDIYSLGIIMIELFTGYEFDNPPTDKQIKELTHTISKDYRYFIRTMVGKPNQRPNIIQVMDKFNIDNIELPSLKPISIKCGDLMVYEKQWISNLLLICNVTGPNKISDFFLMLGLFISMSDYRSDLQFYGLAIVYVYSSYYNNPINYPTLISVAPTYYSRANRKRKIAEKIDFIINNEQFIKLLFTL